MKTILMALVTVLSASAHAGLLDCRGVTKNNRHVWVIVDSTNNFLTVNGAQEAAHFTPGPDDDTLAVITQSAFVGISKKDNSKAVINTAIFDQVPLKCEGRL